MDARSGHRSISPVACLSTLAEPHYLALETQFSQRTFESTIASHAFSFNGTLVSPIQPDWEKHACCMRFPASLL